MDARTAVVPFGAAGRRRSVVFATGAVIALGGMAACGSTDQSGSAGTAQPSVTAVAPSGSPVVPGSPEASPTAVPTASPTAVPAPVPSGGPDAGGPTGPGIAVGEPAPTTAALPATGYALDKGTHLTVFFFGGTCEEYGLKADEHVTGQVRVRVVVERPAPPGKACPAVVVKSSVAAQLGSALGDRKVVDLTSGATLTVSGEVPGGPR